MLKKILSYLLPTNKGNVFLIGDFFRITEVATVPPQINALFIKTFGCDTPTEPVHFVASYKTAEQGWQPMGYAHYSAFEDCYLVGGLVIDELAYRQMTATQRQHIKQYGGIGQTLITNAIQLLPEHVATWAYTGVQRSRDICYQTGFVDAGQYLMVDWHKPLTEIEKEKYIKKITSIGPF